MNFAGISKEKGDTWPKILHYNNARYADKIAMRSKRYGIWRKHTWADYYVEVKYLALGLKALGMEPGNRVAVIGDNAFQWYCAQLAIQSNLGIAAGIYSDLSPQEIKYILVQSQARYAIVEDQEQVDKLLQVLPDLRLLKKIICWNYKGMSHYQQDILAGYEEVLTLGRQSESAADKFPGI